jgi:hypothetical protein
MVRRIVCAVALVVSTMWYVRGAAADVITFDRTISPGVGEAEGIGVPEPTTLMLLGIALVLFASATRRHSNRPRTRNQEPRTKDQGPRA